GGLRLLLVHAGRVEVADLLRERIGGIGFAARVPLQDVVEQRLVALQDLAEPASPGGAVLGDGRPLQPAAAGGLVEVGAGVGRLVHRALVDGGRLLRRRRGAGGCRRSGGRGRLTGCRRRGRRGAGSGGTGRIRGRGRRLGGGRAGRGLRRGLAL